MTTMRALMLREWGGPLEPVELPVPQPGSGEVLIKVATCGIGDTLNNMRLGRNAAMPGASVPRIIGHEVSGTIAAVGPQTADAEVGQRVYVYMYLTCGRCDACKWGHDPMCDALRGIIGLASDGGFAEYMVVPSANIGLIPDEVSDLQGCVAVDAVASPWHALRAIGRIQPTETLVVVGAGGGVGIHAVKLGKLLGARVIGVDITDEKLAFASQHGADDSIDGRQDLEENILDLTDGHGADLVLDYVASAATLHPVFRTLAREGRLVIQGVSPPGDEFRVEPRSFVHRQLSVSGSRYASRREVAEVMELMRRGLIEPIVTRTAPLEGAETLFELLGERKILGRAALIVGSDDRGAVA